MATRTDANEILRKSRPLLVNIAFLNVLGKRFYHRYNAKACPHIRVIGNDTIVPG